jgi:hypothetical protein
VNETLWCKEIKIVDAVSATCRVLLGMVLRVLAHHMQERNKTDETISSAVLFCVLIFSSLL